MRPETTLLKSPPHLRLCALLTLAVGSVRWKLRTRNTASKHCQRRSRYSQPLTDILHLLFCSFCSRIPLEASVRTRQATQRCDITSPSGQRVCKVELFGCSSPPPPNMPILVAYATSRGSTREVAERIADRLHLDGFAVDCRPVDHVFRVENYSAVILGSAVQAKRWLLDALKFLDVEAMDLARKPFWAFSVAMAPAGAPGWVRDRTVKKELKNIEDVVIRKVPKVRDHRLFAGKDDGSTMATPIRGLYRCFGGRFGDLRDWDDIDKWADTIAKELRAEGL